MKELYEVPALNIILMAGNDDIITTSEAETEGPKPGDIQIED